MNGHGVPRAVIYTRVSTEGQADKGTSLDAQLELCRKKAQELGAQIIDHLEDPGVSGALYLTRPGMQAAIGHIEEGRADVLIVANLTRYSRDAEHQMLIKKRVERAGGRLVFCDFAFEPTPEGDLMFGIAGQFAAYERQVIRKRTMVGRRKKAEEGQQPTRSTPPYGYHIVTKADVLRGDYPISQLGRYHIIEDEAELVKELYTRYVSGTSLRGLARWLNDAGVPTARGGRIWRAATLAKILRNPVYRGKPVFGVRETVHDEDRVSRGLRQPHSVRFRPDDQWVLLSAPSIVDAAIWHKVQEKMQEAKVVGRGRPSARPLLLAKLMRCPACGKMMRVQRKERRLPSGTVANDVLYHCPASRPSQTEDGHVCHKRTYSEPRIRRLVTRGIREVTAAPEMLSAALAAARQVREPEAEGRTDHLENASRSIGARIDATVKLQIAAVSKGLDPDIYDETLKDLAAQKERVAAELSHLTARSARGDGAVLDEVGQATAMLREVDEVFAYLAGDGADDSEIVAEANRLLRLVVDDVVPVDEEDGVRIQLKPVRVSAENDYTILIV